MMLSARLVTWVQIQTNKLDGVLLINGYIMKVEVFNNGTPIIVDATCKDCMLHRKYHGGFCNGKKEVCSQIYYNYNEKV